MSEPVCFSCGRPLAEYGCVSVAVDTDFYKTCRAPLGLRKSAVEMKPTFAVCCRVDNMPRDKMPDAVIVRECVDCGVEVWVSPSTREVEKKLDYSLFTVCQECYAPKPGDMGIVTVTGQREMIEMARKRG